MCHYRTSIGANLMSKITLRCDHCGGQCELDPGMQTGFCIHCGTRIIIQPDVYNINVGTSGPSHDAQRKVMWSHIEKFDYTMASVIADAILRANPFDPDSLRVSVYNTTVGVLDESLSRYSTDAFGLYTRCKEHVSSRSGGTIILSSMDMMLDEFTLMLRLEVESRCKESLAMYSASGGTPFSGPESFPYITDESRIVAYLESKRGSLTDGGKYLVDRFLARVDPGNHRTSSDSDPKNKFFEQLFTYLMYSRTLV